MIEPEGFATPDELFAARAATLAALRRAVAGARVFVFTMGLTESWRNQDSGMEYALCPGTAAGRFDPARHTFVNHGFAALLTDMRAALRLLYRANPRLSVLLTVSPVPLTATASGQHVLTATSQSKSVLRAVAGELAARLPQVDYFPSYEIITHPAFGGRFYAPNLREVRPEGVDHVMTCFFRDQAAAFGGAVPLPSAPLPTTPEPEPAEDDTPHPDALSEAEALRCEEEILAAFAPNPAGPAREA
jgi:hypothetical protein